MPLSSVCFRQRLDRAREAVEFGAELRAVACRPAAAVGALDILAQRVEFALQAGRHLLAQLFAQALQLAGDLADGGDAVLLAAHALEVARQRRDRRVVAIRIARRSARSAGAVRLAVRARAWRLPAAGVAAAQRLAMSRAKSRPLRRRVAALRPMRCSSVSSERLSCSSELCARRCLPAFSVSR